MKRGFTLIEILTALLVISVLLSIVWVVYGKSLENARSDATRATLMQLRTAISDRRDAFHSMNLTSQSQQFQRAYEHPAAGNTPNTIPINASELLVAKDRFRGAFPQRLEDTWGFGGSAGGPDDAPLWSAWKRRHREWFYLLTTGEINPTPPPPLPASVPTDANPRPPSHRMDLENVELLMLMLTTSSLGPPGISLDSVRTRDSAFDWNGDGSITSDLYPAGDDLDDDKIADGNNIPEVYDEWDKPLRFYNWPTRLVRPGGEYQGIVSAVYMDTAYSLLVADHPESNLQVWDYGHPLNIDPDDPTALLSLMRDGEDLNGNGALDDPPEDFNPNSILDPGTHPNIGSGFTLIYTTSSGPVTVSARPVNENWYHTLNTFHAPLLLSAGGDGVFGLFDPTTAGPERLAQPTDMDAIQDNVVSRVNR
jgi:prepilin-type N-terminal cleavage/methylation domain-containing protein